MALEGHLQDMSLVDLFQIFRMSSKSGTLLLDNKQEYGVIYVLAGRLLDAVVVRKQEHRVVAIAEDAVLHVLIWEDASFVFRHDPNSAERRPRITRDSDQLVIESMQRRQHAGHMGSYQRVTLESHLVLNAAPGGVESRVTFSLSQWRIMSRISDYNTLRELCVHTGIVAEEALDLAAELIAIGVLDIVATLPMQQAPKQCARNLASTGHQPTATAPRTMPQRPLLQAIMRRVRSL